MKIEKLYFFLFIFYFTCQLSFHLDQLKKLDVFEARLKRKMEEQSLEDQKKKQLPEPELKISPEPTNSNPLTQVNEGEFVSEEAQAKIYEIEHPPEPPEELEEVVEEESEIVKPLVEFNFKHDQIQNTIAYIEFRLTLLYDTITECIELEFEKEQLISIDIDSIRDQCVGKDYNMLNFIHNEFRARLKSVLTDVLLIKFQLMNDIYKNEVDYFLDLIHQLIDSDYALKTTIQIAKKSSKYHSNPRLFDDVVIVSEEEIDKFDEVRKKMYDKKLGLFKSFESKKDEQIFLQKKFSYLMKKKEVQ